MEGLLEAMAQEAGPFEIKQVIDLSKSFGWHGGVAKLVKATITS